METTEEGKAAEDTEKKPGGQHFVKTIAYKKRSHDHVRWRNLLSIVLQGTGRTKC